MADIFNFRSAFNGFNPEDVVHYIDYLNTTHENLVRQLQADLANAHQEPEIITIPQDNSELESLREQCAQQETLLAAVNAEKEALMNRCVQLEAALAANKDASAVVTAAKTPLNAYTDEELAAYRRAERVEREANDRAQGIYRQVKTLLSNATNQTNVAVSNMDDIAEQINNQLSELRTSLLNSKDYLEQTSADFMAMQPSQDNE
jgi:chromosome segregation ATPase